MPNYRTKGKPVAYRASREKAKIEKEGIVTIRNADFWPASLGPRLAFPPDAARAKRIERRRAVLKKQAALLASLLADPPPAPGEGKPFLAYKSGGVWRRIVV